MQIKYQTEYLEDGCEIYGKLVVIRYYEYLKTLPNYGKFGAMTVYDALYKAKEILMKEHPNAEIVLGIPNLVAKI